MSTSASERAIAQALRESEQRFRALVEGIALVVWETDASGRLLENSTSWQALIGPIGDGAQTCWIDAVHLTTAMWSLNSGTTASTTDSYSIASFVSSAKPSAGAGPKLMPRLSWMPKVKSPSGSA